MASSDLLSNRERVSLDRVIREAEQRSRFEFSVYIGSTRGEGTREFATRLHNRLVAPPRSVLIMIEPEERAVEIVTGAIVRERVTDAHVGKALTAMGEEFAQKRWFEGLSAGIELMASRSVRA